MEPIELEGLTHEELVTHALHEARISDNSALADAARDLQDCVDREADSEAEAQVVINLLRA